ncbi:RNA methyltransferase [Devosia pacifica]|uniref:RNA methyltransferase n=1 Tax=Devosia pacifica TaxID=1335967 RepID=A0A918S6H4_9HYPH|nr:class I SAM-dependent RNA methyltransferase [Devosia pacifica]GHA25576.1 RNA methyltransferase [Devosia pacifica]
MTSTNAFEIYLVAVPGLEPALLEEAVEAGFVDARQVEGGVAFDGTWVDVWRANLVLRGATRVLARIGEFRAMHLAQLDKRARKIAWGEVLRAHVPIKVEAACKRSRIYHAGAAAERVATAITETLGAPQSQEAQVRVMVRIEDDLVTLSIDTSGESLHKRGFKQALNRAPMRETMAALFLRQCGYQPGETLLDPMCGSGTFVIEAAEISAGLLPGRGRDFAFEQLSSFDKTRWAELRAAALSSVDEPQAVSAFGSDRDPGAVRMSGENAERAGVAGLTQFSVTSIDALEPPDRKTGLVIVNPPYGTRIGNKAPLVALHRRLGEVLKSRFGGWRVGIITADRDLAKATRLPFLPTAAPVQHGGIRVTLYQTGRL